VLAFTPDGFVDLLAADGTTRSDLRLPDGELGDEIRRVFEQTGELLVDVLNVEGAREEIVRIR